MSTQNNQSQLGLAHLTAAVVGSIVGSGIFNMPSDIARDATLGSVIIGWVIAIVGMLSIAMTFYILTKRYPEIEGGMFNYANKGFGELAGSLTGWGQWLVGWLGNVAYLILIFASLSYFFPIFENGTNWYSFAGMMIFLWGFAFLLSKGVHEASLLNLIIVIAKFVPIFTFIAVLVLFSMNNSYFAQNWAEIKLFSASEIFDQVKNTMLITVWVFIGVEGAVTLSAKAKEKKDVANATIIGLIFVALIYLIVSLLSFNVMSRAELLLLEKPSMGYILEKVAGKWGGIMISIGIIISVAGAFLSWSLLACEVLYVGAKNEKIYPAVFAKLNSHGAPINSALLTTIVSTIFLLGIVILKHEGYLLIIEWAAIAGILPYLLSALFALKMIGKKTGFKTGESNIGDLIWIVLACIYSIWLLYAAGFTKSLPVVLLYLPGIFVYFYAKKQNNRL